jgi:hypothetical protein
VWRRSFYIGFVGVVWGSQLILEAGGGSKSDKDWQVLGYLVAAVSS